MELHSFAQHWPSYRWANISRNAAGVSIAASGGSLPTSASFG